jgi:cytochrome c oxidase assembly factor CtaG
MIHVLGQWDFGPPLTPILIAGFLYSRGMRERTRRGVGSVRQARWFAAGLFVLVVALVSPLAAYDDTLFWAHMLQHVLLLTVAPPLLLLGRPAMTSWRAFPLRLRRTLARAVARSPWWAPLRVTARLALAPPVALGLFLGTMAAWHVPALYNATLSSTAIHYLEHALFLGTGLVFWSRLIDSPPLWSHLTMPARALYATVAMAACSVLAIVIAFASSPLYSGYSPGPAPGGISPLADQQVAAGIMWVPGSLPFVVAAVLFVYRWLDASVERPQLARAAR